MERERPRARAPSSGSALERAASPMAERTEVGKFDAPRNVYEHVLRLEVAMENTLRVAVGDAWGGA